MISIEWLLAFVASSSLPVWDNHAWIWSASLCMDDELALDCDADALCKTARKNLKRASRLQRASTATDVQWQRGSKEVESLDLCGGGFLVDGFRAVHLSKVIHPMNKRRMVLDPFICPMPSIRGYHD